MNVTKEVTTTTRGSTSVRIVFLGFSVTVKHRCNVKYVVLGQAVDRDKPNATHV